MTHLLHALAAATLLAGCSSAPSAATAPTTKEQPMNSSVTLQPERTVAVGPSSLRYDGVEDSRCPPNMNCVWAGELAYKFTLSGPAGQEMFGLTAAKPSFAATTVPGATIALNQAGMPPVAVAAKPVTGVPVTVTISRK